MLSQLFPRSDGSTGGPTKKLTLGARFKKSLTDLMIKVRSTEPHYIRCVKPNSIKSSGVFTGGMALEQLRYAGVFEAVAIRKEGFPFRFPFLSFVRRYKCVLSMHGGRWEGLATPDSDPMGQCQEILAATGQQFSTLQWVHIHIQPYCTVATSPFTLLLFLG